MNIKKYVIIVMSFAIQLFAFVPLASAHVTVKPGEVGVGERLNFVVSVPTEEETPTIQLRLVLPKGLQSVRPNVKPGWTISLTKSNDTATEIIWSGGSIPPDQRDEFVFSAQAPAKETTVVWKAYQTYGDGDIVAWENSPEVVQKFTKNNPPKEGEEDDHNAPRPYSETRVINDLSSSSKTANAEQASNTRLPLMISGLALVVALSSLLIVWQNKGKK